MEELEQILVLLERQLSQGVDQLWDNLLGHMDQAISARSVFLDLSTQAHLLLEELAFLPLVLVLELP